MTLSLILIAFAVVFLVLATAKAPEFRYFAWLPAGILFLVAATLFGKGVL